MIYLLAILWFASGFFGFIYLWVTGCEGDFAFPSEEFLIAVLFGVAAPALWIALVIDYFDRIDFPQITLFKARNK